jgi:hypothetical protein
MNKSKYSEKLLDPRWQKKRLEVFQRDGFACQYCFDTESTLAVHHLYYEKGKEPWDYPLEALITLCSDCHELETQERPKAEAKLLFYLRKKGFNENSLVEFAESIDYMELCQTPEIVMSAISEGIRDKELQQWLINRMLSPKEK